MFFDEEDLATPHNIYGCTKDCYFELVVPPDTVELRHDPRCPNRNTSEEELIARSRKES